MTDFFDFFTVLSPSDLLTIPFLEIKFDPIILNLISSTGNNVSLL